MSEYDLGIDVGTNATRIAIVRNDGSAPEVWRFPSGDLSEPTIVYAGTGGRLVGDAARNAAADDIADATATEFVPAIGLGESILLGRTAWQPEGLVAVIATEGIGRIAEREGAPPRTVVMACPPFWTGARLGKLQAALADIGLGQVRLTGTVQAVALANVAADMIAPGETVATMIMGGSIFTAAIVSITDEGKVRVKSLVGHDRRGGNQTDDALVSRFVANAPARILNE